ncbi:alpha-N-acetylglucosaminidase TIM-barrel domain-containing protein [Bacteroides thetaiotaomicron]|uniref:alpha-N-acetylglucosaminidase TIM-barrel domain-containing protein n=1 Tax=Bacteroides thetaiotaomicron TaxID=818 RepID=UPI0035B407B8
MPLAISGQETVWYKVWSKLGLNDEQIRSYFTGPAHLPWHRMSNVDYWQSPLPKSWLEQQEVLQKQILKRERDFNMTLFYLHFSGHVPKELKSNLSRCQNSRNESMGGYDSKISQSFYRTNGLSVQHHSKMYLEEQTAIYGTRSYLWN